MQPCMHTAHCQQPPAVQAHLERLLADGGRGAGQPCVRLRHHRHVRHRQLQRAAALLLRDQACADRARAASGHARPALSRTLPP